MKTLEEYAIAKIEALLEQVGTLAELNDQYAEQLTEKTEELCTLIAVLNHYIENKFSPIYGDYCISASVISHKYDPIDYDILTKYFPKEAENDEASEAEASEA